MTRGVAYDTCKKDKKKFLEEIEAVKETITKMEEPIEWTEMTSFPPDLNDSLDQYQTDV